jgi:flagellar protein FlgJ
MSNMSLSLDPRQFSELKKAAQAAPNSEAYNKAIDKAAVMFESVFLQMALKSMREATPEGGLFTDNTQKTYQAMYDQELVQSLSGKGLGLAQEIARQLKKAS